MGHKKGDSKNIMRAGNGLNRYQIYAVGLFAFLGVFIGASMWATQYFASQYGYQPALGSPLFHMMGKPIYMPLDWFAWFWRYGDYDAVKPVLTKVQIIGFFGTLASIAAGYFALIWASQRDPGYEEMHGSAHWANKEEVSATGYLADENYSVDGVYIGSVAIAKRDDQIITPWHPDYRIRYRMKLKLADGWQGKMGVFSKKVVMRDAKTGQPLLEPNPKVFKLAEFLRDDGPTHVIAFAPTRSGKGVGIVLPTLYGWRHSVVVNDIKGENWALTAGFRKSAGQIVFKFEPACTDGTGAKWNPLDEIRTFTINDVQDAQNILGVVCDPEAKGMDDHWVATSWEFLTGLALHMRYAERDASLSGMAFYMADPAFETADQMYTTMLNAEHDPEMKMGWTDSSGRPTKTHPVVANAAQAMLNKEEKERGSVLSTCKRLLSLFVEPVVASNTRTSDFLVKDLMNLDQPVSCYYVAQPNDQQRLRPLTRLFFSLILNRNTEKMNSEEGRMVGDYKHRLLMLIDELPALKKLEQLQLGLGYIAGFGIKCLLICQDLIQLEEVYGKDQTIVAGCHVRIAYAPNTLRTAKEISEMLSKTTVNEEKASTSGNIAGLNIGSESVSLDKTGRELMTEGEVMSLSQEDMLIFVQGCAPIYGKKIKYYQVPAWDAASRMPAPVRCDRVVRETENGRLLSIKVIDGVAEYLEQNAPAEDQNAPTDVQTAVAAALGISVDAMRPEFTPDEQAAIDSLLSQHFAVNEVLALDAFTAV